MQIQILLKRRERKTGNVNIEREREEELIYVLYVTFCINKGGHVDITRNFI